MLAWLFLIESPKLLVIRTHIKVGRDLISGTFRLLTLELLGPEKTIALLKTIQNILMTSKNHADAPRFDKSG